MLEMLDIVDHENQVVGAIDRDLVTPDLFIRTRWVALFIINDEGKIWIPRRAKHKKVLPHHWDASACGMVISGESFDEAMRRESGEEIGDYPLDTLSQVAVLSPYTHDLHFWWGLYTIKSNMTPQYNRDDFDYDEWMTSEEITAKEQRGEKFKMDMVSLIRHISTLL